VGLQRRRTGGAGADILGRYTARMKLLRVTLIGLACALPVLSLAEWQWIDKDGHKVYSDQSPPADIPAKNILKQPGVKNRADAPAEPAAAASQVARPAAPAPKVSGKDKELEEKKKKTEAAEAEKKKAEEDERAKLRADNCTRAKGAKASFDSGVRVTRTNEKGEREFLDDAARAAETKRLQGIIATDCAAQ
jgi:type IV secretory pathway VirB10-like protein